MIGQTDSYIRSVSLDQVLSSSLLSWGTGKAHRHLDVMHMSGEDPPPPEFPQVSEDTQVLVNIRQLSKSFRVAFDIQLKTLAMFAINMIISKPGFTRIFSM